MLNRTLIIALGLAGIAMSALLYGSRVAPRSAVAAAPSAPSATAPSPAPQPRTTPTDVTTLAAIAPEVQLLSARRELYESVDALVQASQFEEARQLLDSTPSRFPDDSSSEWRDVEQSYRLIADCLERPNARLRARANAFVQVSEARGLAPRIRSACQLTGK
jgi:hypothetical protein